MLRTDSYFEQQSPSPLKLALVEFKRHPIFMAAFYVLIGLTLIAAISPLFASHGYHSNDPSNLLVPPAWSDNGKVQHFLGTDDLGRDLLTRLLVGTSYSFGAALVITLLAAVVGVVVGAFAALTRGFKSSVLNHLLDATQSIPSLLLALVVIAVMGTGLQSVYVAILLAQIPMFIRVTYDSTIAVMRSDYVTAAKLDGQSGAILFARTIFLNITTPLTLQFMASLSNAILDTAALGFLRLGAQPPSSEWGVMLADGMEVMYQAPWTVALPGIALFITLLSINVASEGLRFSLAKYSR